MSLSKSNVTFRASIDLKISLNNSTNKHLNTINIKLKLNTYSKLRPVV